MAEKSLKTFIILPQMRDGAFMQKSLILAVLLIVSSLGCSHCSVTRTNFDGKTSGINPYGAGEVEVERESYWGTNQCVVKLMEMK